MQRYLILFLRILTSTKTEKYIKKILKLAFWFLLLLPVILIPLYFFIVSVM
jgi:hypothetical protein